MSSKRAPSTEAEQCLKSAVKQLRLLLKKAESGEKVDMSAVKELTAVMKELVKLRQALAEDSGREDAPTVQVVWGAETEELAQ